MIIYCPSITNRLSYTLKIIFENILKADFIIIDTLESSENSQDILISYSEKPLKDSFHIFPSGLLTQTGIQEQNISIGNINELVTIFHSGKGDIPFDIFSAIFYMISRYEEYLPFEGDLHGRFKAEESLAFKNGFHHLPIVELWCKLLAEKLNISFPENTYKNKLTIDIDNAWKHKNKGVLRNAGGFIKLLLSGNWEELNEKIKVLSGKMSDPADTFEYLETIQRKLKEPIQYFILAGTKGKNDRAVSLKNKAYRQLLQKLGTKKSLGLHPSYLSFKSVKELENEYLLLCGVFINKITKSRQHYLLLKLPETYRNIIKLGIREDYSMGWSSQVGFRAGIARPYRFYDLLAEKETHLLIVPFMAMDRTLKDYMKLNPDDAIIQLKNLSDITKSAGGEFVQLWHNDSLSNLGEWKGWRTVFEQATEYAESNKAS